MMLVALALTLGGPTSAQDVPTLSVDPATKRAHVGETFTVSVAIDDAQDVVGYQFMLDFDPGVVALSNPTDGGFLDSPASCTIAGGTASCTALDTPPYDGGASGSGTLVTFDLEVVGTGETALALHNAQVSDVDADTVEPDLEDGLVSSLVELEVVPPDRERSVNVGAFTETVMIHNASDLAGFEFKMDFDPDILQVQDVALTPFLESEGRTVNPALIQEDWDNVKGTLFFAAASLPPGDGPDGSGALVVIDFQAVATGTTTLDLHDSKVYDTTNAEGIPRNLDGVIHVVDEGIQVVPTHSEVFEEESFAIDIQVGDAQDLIGFEFTLGFDETVVNVDDVELGPFITALTTTKVIDNDDGTAFFGAFSLPPGRTADVGTLATVHLTALETDVDVTSALDIMDPAFFNSLGDETIPKDTDGDVLVKNCVPVAIESLVADSSVADPTMLGEAIHFTATVTGTEPISYDWAFDGAGTAADDDTATPSFTYDAAGIYTVTLTAENCGGPVEETVVVRVCDPVAIESLVADSSVTNPTPLGQAVHFTATVTGTEPISYDWAFDGAGTASGHDTATPTFTYDAAGTYTVTLTAENCGGAVEETVVVRVCDAVDLTDLLFDAPVRVNAEVQFTAVATGTEPMTYEWDFGDGTQLGPLSVNVASHTYTETGPYTVTVVASNCSGVSPFTDTISRLVTVEPYRIYAPIIANDFNP
jgi:PKD repeat protein